ncbi:MAG: aldehyde dehydrogenase family protein [Deltaproteobacteria bacterium]|nr:aldehyde dehydrogenase family protein [Deltaproteobacteria bacterium]
MTASSVAAVESLSQLTSSRTTIVCTDPATGERIGEAPVMSPDEVRETVRRSHTAQERWARTSFAARRAVLRHMLDHLLANLDELIEVVVRDSGKIREHALVETWPVCEKLRTTIADGEKHLRPEPMSAGLFKHKKARVEYPPLGVIGIIAPWNYPLQNILGPAIPALFAGNGVVIKVSEWTSYSVPRIQRIFDEALTAAGQSTDLVRIITGYGETGAALVGSGVDKIIFTGSVGNGRRVLAESAKTLTPVILELGGKDPLIVCDDADLEQAAHAAIGGAFVSCGQNCIAPERVLVFDAVYEAFEKRVVEIVGAFRQGPPLAGQVVDVGAMTMPAQVDLVERLVNDAVAKGAKALVGGKRASHGGGRYFQPTVLSGVTPDMAIFQEETFGPVLALVRVKDEEDAIRVANATEFGLSSAVFSKDHARAERIGERLVAGSTNINDFGLHYMAQALPFGGVKASGFGRLNGREGLRACTNPKAVLTDRFPIHIPPKMYPIRRGDYARLRGVLGLLYGRGIGARLKGLAGILTAPRG